MTGTENALLKLYRAINRLDGLKRKGTKLTPVQSRLLTYQAQRIEDLVAAWKVEEEQKPLPPPP